MRTHEEFEALLDAFVDGELSPEDMQAVQAHLNTCPDCRAYVDAALAIRAAFPSAEEVEVPAGFAEGVMSAIRAQAPAAPKQRKQPWGKLLLPIAACFAVVLVLRFANPAASEEAAPAAEESMQFSLADEAPEAEAPEARMAEEPAAAAPPAEEARDAAEFSCFTHVSLSSADAGGLLDGLTPVQETDELLCYALSEEEYHTLMAQLADRDIVPAEETPVADGYGDWALVTVLK